MQAASLVHLRRYAGPDGDALADLVAEYGGLLGGAARSEPDGPALVRCVFNLAVALARDHASTCT